MRRTVHPPTAGFLVWRLAMKWQAAVDRAVRELGLTHGQYSLLASLRGMTAGGDEPPSQRDLAEHTGLDPVFVSKLIKALDELGLVARSRDPDDARAFQLELTPEGIELVDRAVEVVLALLDELLEPLGGRRGAGTKRFAETIERLLAVPT